MPENSYRAAIYLVVLVSVAACRHQAVEGAPLPTPTNAAAPAPPESSKVLATYDEIIRQVDATEEAFLNINLAAASYLGYLTPGKSIGFYQPELASPEFKDMVEEVTRRYAFRPVRPADFRYSCDPRGTCAMVMADAIVQFNTTKMSVDSGYVGGSITQVPRGGHAPETKAFCITVARKPNEWKPIRSAWVPTGRQCPATRGS